MHGLVIFSIALNAGVAILVIVALVAIRRVLLEARDTVVDLNDCLRSRRKTKLETSDGPHDEER